jgi:hypothetical protein
MPGPYVRNVLRLTSGAPGLADVLRKAAEHPGSAPDLVCPTCRQPGFGIFESKVATIHACVRCAGVHFGPGQYQAAFPGSKMMLGGGLPSGAQVTTLVAAEVAASLLAALLS